MARRALLFLLLLAGLDVVLGALFARGFARVRSGASGGLANQAIAVQAPLLILGSSRAQHHLDPRVLGEAAGLRAWNAGADGQGLYYACSLVDLVEGRSPPRLVVWNIDWKDFDARDRPGQLQRLSVLLPHYDESARLRELWRSQGYEARLKVQVRTYRFNSLALPMLVRLFDPPAPPPDAGFVPIATKPGALDEGRRQEFEDADSQALAALEETLKGLSERGSEVVLMTSPTWTSGEPPARFYARIEQAVGDVAGRIPRVHVWRMDEAARPQFLDPALYVDAGHLNVEGAGRLSALVAERIRSEIRPRLAAALR